MEGTFLPSFEDISKRKSHLAWKTVKGIYGDATVSLYVIIIVKAVMVRNWKALFVYLCKAFEMCELIHLHCFVNNKNALDITHRTLSHTFLLWLTPKDPE